MDDSPEVIRHQMEETRASLSNKLEQLEQQVLETVHGAKNAVHETVDDVKEAVHDTAEAVKETFDIAHQMQKHPWAIFGGSIALGFLGAKLLERSDPDPSRSGDWHAPPPWYHAPQPGRETNGELHPGANGATPTSDNGAADSGMLSSLTSQFGPELQRLKGMALGAAMGVVRDLLAGSIPDPLKPQVAEVMDSITVKLGGAPVRGPLLSQGDDDAKCNPSKMGRSMGPT